MFKKSPKTKQFNLFSSPSGLMCKRESRMYDDESAWHWISSKRMPLRLFTVLTAKTWASDFLLWES